MKMTSVNRLLVLTGLLMAVGCTTEKKVEKKPVFNSDIENATEISLEGYFTERSNTGYGNVMEVKASYTNDTYLFDGESNSAWYKLVIPENTPDNTLVSMALEPNNGLEDYDFLIYKYTDQDFASDVVNGSVMPVRSNLAHNGLQLGYATGLSCEAGNEFESASSEFPFGKSLLVNKNEIYYLVTNTKNPDGKGYNIRFSICKNEAANTNNAAFEAYGAPSVKPLKKKYVVLPLNEGEEYYTVEPKNTVYSTATMHGMTVEELMELNKLKSYHIEVGQRLKVRRRYAKDTKTADAKHGSFGNKPAPVNSKKDVTPKARGTQSASIIKDLKDNAGAVSSNKKESNTSLKTAANDHPVTAKPRKSGVAASSSIEHQNKIVPGKAYYIYLHAFNSSNSKPISTEVKLVDSKNSKLFDKIATNAIVPVPTQENGSRSKILVCEPFGYRKMDFDLNLDKIINDTTKSYTTVIDDTIVINLEMERYRKNDIVVMYNVFFYDDASVMLPKSKFELESLLEMMNENPNIKIRLHGHTNGGSMGKIIKLENGDNNFFTVSSKNKETYGTAAMLSKARAETIKYYLVDQGINENRVDIVGWGGKSPLYEASNPLAYKNKRVEVEIVEDK
jgi:outer membrane protein OmpA-like peptidoglycan-associated protein